MVFFQLNPESRPSQTTPRQTCDTKPEPGMRLCSGPLTNTTVYIYAPIAIGKPKEVAPAGSD